MLKIYNSVLKGSLLDCPFVPAQKCMDIPSQGDKFVGYAPAIASFASGLLNFFSQEKANDVNEKTARENQQLQRETNQLNAQLQREVNEQNYKMFQEQNAFTLDMWNKQNAYNDPSAQVQRMLNAGINPSMAFGKDTPASSIQSASGSPAQAAQMVAPRMDYRYNPIDYSQMGNALNAYYQNQLLNEQAKKVAADGQISAASANVAAQKNMLELVEIQTRIDNMLKSGKLTDAQRENLETQRDQIQQQINLIQHQWDDLVVKEKKNNALTDASTQNQLASALVSRTQAHLNSILAEYQPMLMQANINLTDAQARQALENVVVLAQEGRLTSANAVSKELANQLDLQNVKKELDKHKIRNASKFYRRLFNSLEVIGESVFSGLKGILK